MNPWETGKKFSDVEIGIWDLKLKGKWKKKVGGIWFMHSHTWEVEFFFFFFFSQITFFPSLLSAFKLDHIIPRGVKLKSVQIKLYNF